MKPKILYHGIPIVGRMPLFTFDNRQAVRDGLKTQTRRLNGLEEINQDSDRWQFVGFKDDKAIFRIPGRTQRWIKLPWAVGDTRCMCEPLIRGHDGIAYYRDDIDNWSTDEWYTASMAISLITREPLEWRWKRDYLASIHMPTEAARTVCKITDIRIERLQKISEEDAKAEGTVYYIASGGIQAEEMSMRAQFGMLWDSIYAAKDYGWDTNPWVWVNVFEKMEV